MKTLTIGRPTFERQIYNVDIEPRKSIRLYGSYENHVEYVKQADGRYISIPQPKPFDITFKIGDRAEYHSYNLSYVGTITNIGEKTVTIKHYEHTSESSRLDLWHFAWRNWDFDAERIAKENSEEMMCI